MSSKIEWTEDTWNPIIGCDKISAGCKNCYAIRTAWIRMHNKKMSLRYAGVVEKTANGQLNWTGKVNFVNEALQKPVLQKKPTIYFVNSMSDLFHDSLPFEYIDAIFSVMSDADHHIYQILTKRPKRMVEFFEWKRQQYGIMWEPKPNVCLGVSVEDQKSADERIPLLLQVPCTVRFLSCEPLLGPIDIYQKLAYGQWQLNLDRHQTQKIHWVIAGGESGRGARAMHPDWAQSLKDQCYSANVPFFFKQWGDWSPISTLCEEAKKSKNIQDLGYNEQWLNLEGGMVFRGMGFHWDHVYRMRLIGKKKAGNLLFGTTYEQYPKMITDFKEVNQKC